MPRFSFISSTGNHARKKGHVCHQHFCDTGLATHLRSYPIVIDDAVALYGVNHQKSWDNGQLGLERSLDGVAALLCMHQSVAPLTGSLNQVSKPSPSKRDRFAVNVISYKSESKFGLNIKQIPNKKSHATNSILNIILLGISEFTRSLCSESPLTCVMTNRLLYALHRHGGPLSSLRYRLSPSFLHVEPSTLPGGVSSCGSRWHCLRVDRHTYPLL